MLLVGTGRGFRQGIESEVLFFLETNEEKIMQIKSFHKEARG